MEDNRIEGAPRKASKKKRRRLAPALLERIQPDAAGIDCGATDHYVAVARDRDPQPVRKFRTFTTDLHHLADWLVKCGIKTVAIESTGVYWIPVHEILEERGLEVVLVNARDVHNVRGRKSDVSECEWLQELHTVGLLRPSFRPAAAIVALRAYVRHRQSLVEAAATCIQRMQKALTQMNLQLHHVLSDIAGVTGLAIVRDILAGVRDPQALAAHRDRRCHASEQEIAAALTGNYRAEHLFVLRQNFEAYEFNQRQIAGCDRAIEARLATLVRNCEPPKTALPVARPRKKLSKNEPRLELRSPLHRITGGTDLSQIDGIAPYGALQLLAEIGTDMSRWATEKHFTSWLTLAPNNKVSGGRLLSSKTQPSANRAAAILRRAAMSLTRSATALGAYYRRMAYRHGAAKAITATARKLAVLVYRVLRGHHLPRSWRHRLRRDQPQPHPSQSASTRAQAWFRVARYSNRRTARPPYYPTTSFLREPKRRISPSLLGDSPRCLGFSCHTSSRPQRCGREILRLRLRMNGRPESAREPQPFTP